MRTPWTIAITAACVLVACDGDWLGPAERGARAAFDGWDMWATAAVRPYEEPMPPAVEGTVPVGGREGFEEGLEQARRMERGDRRARARLAYRRYCHHCHGPNGDGRIVVGESFDVRPTDLRSEAIRTTDDAVLFERVRRGERAMLPLGATVSARDLVLAIEHVRGLADAPSRPYFPRRFVRPIR